MVLLTTAWPHYLLADVEQPFDCLIVQNIQAIQAMGRSSDWTFENIMVDGLFFCATLTGRRGGHTLFVQVGEETSNTGAEADKPDTGSSWRMAAGVGDENALWLLSAHSAFHW